MTPAHAIDLPIESRLSPLFPAANLADAFAIALPADASGNLIDLARSVIAALPAILAPLMRTRDAVMGRLGVKTSKQLRQSSAERPLGAIGAFGVEAMTTDEVVMGENDRHLNFKTSFLNRPTVGGRKLI